MIDFDRLCAKLRWNTQWFMRGHRVPRPVIAVAAPEWLQQSRDGRSGAKELSAGRPI